MKATLLRVGLTGNIAAGKSTVGARLAEHGCLVLDLDALGHECLGPDEPARDEVVAAFGSDILDPDGRVDRRALGRLVFADRGARERLERILHPCIRRKEQEAVERWATGVEGGIAVSEAALLYETGGAARYHRMVVVVAPDEARLARLTARGLGEAEARRRMAAQMDQRRKAERADYVVDNAGDLGTLRRRVDELAGELRGDLQALWRGDPLP